MEFHDVLYGPIHLGLPFNKALFEELLTAPEVERLRNMRLMNFDVSLIQELGSAKRLPHSIGVCYLAQELGKRTLTSESTVSVLMVAALLHDAAIPPYGHLVEAMLRKRHPNFNHEQILRDLLFGTYHVNNSYHQIVPGRSLKLHSILNKYDIDLNKVLSLVQPNQGSGSAISAQIDLDNIDNVHRMARLLGWPGAKSNLQKIIENIRLDDHLRLEFKRESLSALQTWQEFRQRLYTLIIAHPNCVAQNAFQSDLVKKAIEESIIAPETWFISDPQFEEALRHHPATKHYADQLLAGSQYRLVDYVWFAGIGEPPSSSWMTIDERMKPDLPRLRDSETYFFWIESGLISRTVNAKMVTGEEKQLGDRSNSCLVARVHTSAEGIRPPALGSSVREKWRTEVCRVFGEHTNGFETNVWFPENYTGSYFRTNKDVKQLELC